MEKIVVLYSLANDPVVTKLSQHAEGVEVVHVDELLPYIEKGAWPRPFICRFAEDIRATFSGNVCVNRTQFLEGSEFAKHFVINEQGGTAWADEAVNMLLSICDRTIYEPGRIGISRSFLPLPTQWWLFRQIGPHFGKYEFQTPMYDYPFGSMPPQTDGFDRTLFKSVWDYFNWRDEGVHKPGTERFVVNRPEGTPLLCTYFGCNYFLDTFRSDCRIDHELIKYLVSEMQNIFKSEWGEFLIFVKDNVITFCAFSGSLVTESDEVNFDICLSSYCKHPDVLSGLAYCNHATTTSG